MEYTASLCFKPKYEFYIVVSWPKRHFILVGLLFCEKILQLAYPICSRFHITTNVAAPRRLVKFLVKRVQDKNAAQPPCCKSWFPRWTQSFFVLFFCFIFLTCHFLTCATVQLRLKSGLLMTNQMREFWYSYDYYYYYYAADRSRRGDQESNC